MMDPSLVELFCDDLNMRMISAVGQRPRSARELAILLKIPVSRTYRRIKRLENAGILAVRDRVPSGFGKRENLYESRLRSFEIVYEVGAISLHCIVEGREPIVMTEQFRDEILMKLQTPWNDAVMGPSPPPASGPSAFI
jgi:DNA-binding MarR family transcriptional regulator